MFKSKLLAVLVVSAASVPAFANPDLCASVADDVFLAQRELDNFQQLVIEPLRKDLERTQAQLRVKIDRPKVLRQAIARTEQQIRNVQAEYDRVNGVIETENQQAEQADTDAATSGVQAENFAKQAADLAGQADAALAAGNKAEAQKLRQQSNQAQASANQARAKAKQLQNRAAALRKTIADRTKSQAARQAQIAKLQGDNEARTAEITSIETTPPSIGELELKIDELMTQLGNERALRDEKNRKLAHEQEELNMCRSYRSLEHDYMDLQMRYNDLAARCTR